MSDYFEKFPDLLKGITVSSMKEKLVANEYSSHVDFLYDFRTMFENIIIYFEPDSIQVKKAKELQIVFEEKWKKAEKAFVFEYNN